MIKWVIIGIAVVGIGAAFVFHKEIIEEYNAQTAPQPAVEVKK